MLGPLQALAGAYDADVVPHEAPQFVPVVRNDHVLVRVGHLAGVPAGQGLGHGHLLQVRLDVGSGGATIYKTFQQRVAGHAVGAVQAGETGFADGIQARHVGVAAIVDHHSAAGVMRRWHHRDRLTGDIDAKGQAALVHGGEVALDEVRRLVSDVQVYAVHAQALHLVVDGAGHDVPWGQLFAWVEARHEAFAVGQAQQGALAAQGFGDQETLGLRVIQAGGVELVEFQVRHPAAGPPGHGDTVAAGAIGVAGIEVDLGRTASGQHGEARAESVYLAGIAVEHVGAQAALAG